MLILVPKTSSPLLICLFTLPCFHVQLHWTQTSELSSFVALTTRRPLIWWLSHWCIDGTEPVSLPASLSPSLQLSSYTDSHEPTSSLIKVVFTCQLPLLVFQVQCLKVTRCIDQLGKKTFEMPHWSHDSRTVCLHALEIHPLHPTIWAARSGFFQCFEPHAAAFILRLRVQEIERTLKVLCRLVKSQK